MSNDTEGVMPSPCPACGQKLNAATCTTGDSRPQEGHPTVCAFCATILTFDSRGAVVMPTAAQRALWPLETHAELALVQALARGFALMVWLAKADDE